MPRCSLWHSFSAALRANNGGLFFAILCCNLDFITPLTQGPTAGQEAGQMRVVSFFSFFFGFVLFFFPTCQQPRTPNALSLSAQQYPSACVPPPITLTRPPSHTGPSQPPTLSQWDRWTISLKEPFLGRQNQSCDVMAVLLVWGICDTRFLHGNKLLSGQRKRTMCQDSVT